MSENNEASSIIDDVSRVVVVGKRRALERTVKLQNKQAARARTSQNFPQRTHQGIAVMVSFIFAGYGQRHTISP
jgi:hypothetical protein